MAPQDDDTTLERDTLGAQIPRLIIYSGPRSPNLSFTLDVRLTPTCLTPAAGSTEGITVSEILPGQSDSAFVDVCPEFLGSWKHHQTDYVSVSLYEATWKSTRDLANKNINLCRLRINFLLHRTRLNSQEASLTHHQDQLSQLCAIWGFTSGLTSLIKLPSTHTLAVQHHDGNYSCQLREIS